MKKTLLILFLFTTVAQAQELAVDNSSKITIENGASLNIGGLELAPSTTYDVSGAITITKSETPITGSNGTSIDRVYNNSNAMNGFEGTMTFHYEDIELVNSGANESTLKLQVKESPSGIWAPFTGTIDQALNTITYTFSSIDFLSITAAGDGVTLPVEDFGNDLDEIKIYPNPTTSILKISTDRNLSYELYNLFGQRILRTKKSSIEMLYLPNAVYFLKVTDEDSNFSKSYKIVKE